MWDVGVGKSSVTFVAAEITPPLSIAFSGLKRRAKRPLTRKLPMFNKLLRKIESGDHPEQLPALAASGLILSNSPCAVRNAFDCQWNTGAESNLQERLVCIGQRAAAGGE